MINEELRTILREEIGGAFVGFREEMNSFKGEVNTSFSAFKSEMREEMNTAIQASETRMTLHMDQRIDQVQKNVLEVKGNVALLDQKVDTVSRNSDQSATDL